MNQNHQNTRGLHRPQRGHLLTPGGGTEKYHRIVCHATSKPVLFGTSQHSARGTLFAKIPAFLSEPPYHSFSFEGRTIFYFFLLPSFLPTPGRTGGFVMLKAIRKSFPGKFAKKRFFFAKKQLGLLINLICDKMQLFLLEEILFLC